MITFSNLFEAAQPVPPQQPVQQTGAQVPQQQPAQPVQQQPQFNQNIHQILMKQYPTQYGSLTPEQQLTVQQYYQSQYGTQQAPAQEKPSGIFNAIKSGYKFINDKYEAGKAAVKDYGGVVVPALGSVGMMLGYRVPGPVGQAMLYGGLATNLLSTLNAASKRVDMVNQQRTQQQQIQQQPVQR